MTETDRPDFAALLAGALGFWRQPVTPFVIDVWWQACQGVELEQLRRALSAHAVDPDRGQYPPKPADIVRVLHGTSADRSLVAWGKVMTAMPAVGAYASVVFDDPAIHAAIEDLGGWPTLCRSGVDELPFLQRRFCDAHRAFAFRSDQAYPPRLIGVHEAANRIEGREVSPPVYVGDVSRAMQVERLGHAGPRVAITAGAVVADAARLAGASA